MTTQSPRIPPSRHQLETWLMALYPRHPRHQPVLTPYGAPITRPPRLVDTTSRECLPSLFGNDGGEAGIVASGATPRYLGSGRVSGEAWFELTAPCVVWLWAYAAGQLRSEVIVVLSGRQLKRVQDRLVRPEPGLMRDLVALIHRPKRGQQKLGQPRGGETDAH